MKTNKKKNILIICKIVYNYSITQQKKINTNTQFITLSTSLHFKRVIKNLSKKRHQVSTFSPSQKKFQHYQQNWIGQI